MKKIKLGQRPETVPAVITLAMPDGTEGKIAVQFKYRTKTEFATWLAERSKALTDEVGSTQDASLADVVQRGLEHDSALAAEYVCAWDLDEPLTQENLQQLFDEVPSASNAFYLSYQNALIAGRMGN